MTQPTKNGRAQGTRTDGGEAWPLATRTPVLRKVLRAPVFANDRRSRDPAQVSRLSTKEKEKKTRRSDEKNLSIRARTT